MRCSSWGSPWRGWTRAARARTLADRRADARVVGQRSWRTRSERAPALRPARAASVGPRDRTPAASFRAPALKARRSRGRMRRSEFPGDGRARPPGTGGPAAGGTARNRTVLHAEGIALSPAQFRTATAAATDVGRRRTGNEDCFSLWTADAGHPQAADVLL